ncbi:hypothetical protein HAHE_00400 [Haloferula helveola]|uniref:Peptidase C39-like domain-containing protein n=1 Tax=Haloferula helveola TaxID=490095 RepID=A0ABM7R9S6_9BACT|nr:hypothetical protein HAHE_00400 [Haloferula helveola]
MLATLLLAGSAMADERWAPHAVAGPVDQLSVAGNACGPAALLASLRCGSEKWRGVPERIPGSSDKSKLLYIIRAHGIRPSASLKGRNRWTGAGINAEDLADIAEELAAIGGLPNPKTESILLQKREKPDKLLRRSHDRLRDSLKDGFPPVLSLRRYVWRNGAWQALQGHFVTVVMVPEKLERGASSHEFVYFDPWGGKKVRGSFRIPPLPVLSTDGKTSSCLEAVVPDANIGRSKVRSGERTVVVPTVITGRW